MFDVQNAQTSFITFSVINVRMFYASKTIEWALLLNASADSKVLMLYANNVIIRCAIHPEKNMKENLGHVINVKNLSFLWSVMSVFNQFTPNHSKKKKNIDARTKDVGQPYL